MRARHSGGPTRIEGSDVRAASEDDIKGLFDDLDINSSTLGNTVAKCNEKLVRRLDAIGDLLLGNVGDHSPPASSCSRSRSPTAPCCSWMSRRSPLASVKDHATGGEPAAHHRHEAVDIQALNDEIARVVARQAERRSSIEAIVAYMEGAG